MEVKEILLSNLINKSQAVKEKVTFVKEKPFLVFSRAVSQASEAKCLFIGASKFARNIDEHTRMVITNSDTYAKIEDKDCGFCITEHPRDLFFQLMDEYERGLMKELPDTIVGKDCHISPLALVAPKGVVIGNRVTIEAFARIEPNTIIGDDSIICAGSKIGTQAFNLYDYHGKRQRLFHGGKTMIGKNVLISENTVVEQALYWYLKTRIGDNTKIDANVVVGHNDCIGENCEITAGANVAGFVTMGNDVVVRLGASISNGVRIGDGAQVGIGAVIIHNVKAGANMFGNPAKDFSRFSK